MKSKNFLKIIKSIQEEQVDEENIVIKDSYGKEYYLTDISTSLLTKKLILTITNPITKERESKNV